MTRDWRTDEIIEHFTLLEYEQELIRANAPHNKLGQALLLKFFQCEARFPEERTEIPRQAVEYVAQQLGVSPETFEEYDWQGRSIKTHRSAIREFMNFRPASLTDQDELHHWLINDLLPHEHRTPYLEELVYSRLRKLHLEPPSHKQVKRLVTSALYQYEQAFFVRTIEHRNVSRVCNNFA